MFPSRELKIVPLGWGSGVSSEAGICANMGLGERLLPRRVAGGVGRMAREPRPPVEDAPSWPQPPSISQRRRLSVSRLPRPYWAQQVFTLNPTGPPGSRVGPLEMGRPHSSAGSILVPTSQCPSHLRTLQKHPRRSKSNCVFTRTVTAAATFN